MCLSYWLFNLFTTAVKTDAELNQVTVAVLMSGKETLRQNGQKIQLQCELLLQQAHFHNELPECGWWELAARNSVILPCRTVINVFLWTTRSWLVAGAQGSIPIMIFRVSRSSPISSKWFEWNLKAEPVKTLIEIQKLNKRDLRC